MLLAFFGCVPYLLQAGWHQAELLASRRPVEEVLATGGLGAGEEQRLRLVPRIKDFGARIGLEATDNYESYAWHWDRRIWNISASEPLRFQNRSWWFPIVGKVPYLGYFRREDADRLQARLEARGWEVWVREAGAYSTLGWFRDPLLPGMLRWSEGDLAETILHELAHATLWIPGSVSFNETFANVVGEAAARRYLVETYGEGSAPVVDWDDDAHDVVEWRRLLHDLYEDLDALYRDPALDDATRRRRKAELFASLPERVEASALVRKRRFSAIARAGPWNNARMLQYRAYNDRDADFRAILAREQGDVAAFIAAIATITRNQRDPAAALRLAVQNP